MKKYVNPVVDILHFSQEDCIRTSGDSYFDNELPVVPFFE